MDKMKKVFDSSKKLFQIILFFKPNKKTYKTEVSTKTKMTYAHASRLMDKLQKKGLIKRCGYEKRRKLYELTKDGKKCRKHLKNVKKYLNKKIPVKTKRRRY